MGNKMKRAAMALCLMAVVCLAVGCMRNDRNETTRATNDMTAATGTSAQNESTAGMGNTAGNDSSAGMESGADMDMTSEMGPEDGSDTAAESETNMRSDATLEDGNQESGGVLDEMLDDVERGFDEVTGQ